MTSKWPPRVDGVDYGKLFVGGLKKEHTEEILEKYFSDYGRLRYCKIPKDKENENQNRGFAFISFYDIADAALALRRPHKIGHWSIHVKPADPSKRKRKDGEENKIESNEACETAEDQNNKTEEQTHGAVNDAAGCSQDNKQPQQNNYATAQRFPRSNRQRGGSFQHNNRQREQFQQPHAPQYNSFNPQPDGMQQGPYQQNNFRQGQYNPYNPQQGQFPDGMQQGPYQQHNFRGYSGRYHHRGPGRGGARNRFGGGNRGRRGGGRS